MTDQVLLPTVISRYTIQEYMKELPETTITTQFLKFLEPNTQSVEHKDCFAVVSHVKYDVVSKIKDFSKNAKTLKSAILQLIHFGLRKACLSHRTPTIEETSESIGFLPDFNVLNFKKLIYTYMDEIAGIK